MSLVLDNDSDGDFFFVLRSEEKFVSSAPHQSLRFVNMKRMQNNPLTFRTMSCVGFRRWNLINKRLDDTLKRLLEKFAWSVAQEGCERTRHWNPIVDCMAQLKVSINYINYRQVSSSVAFHSTKDDDDEWDKEKRYSTRAWGQWRRRTVTHFFFVSPIVVKFSFVVSPSHPSYHGKKKSSTRKWKGMRLKIVGFAPPMMITISDETSYWPSLAFVDATAKISKPFGQCRWAVLRESRQWVLMNWEVNRDAQDKQSPCLSPR